MNRVLLMSLKGHGVCSHGILLARRCTYLTTKSKVEETSNTQHFNRSSRTVVLIVSHDIILLPSMMLSVGGHYSRPLLSRKHGIVFAHLSHVCRPQVSSF